MRNTLVIILLLWSSILVSQIPAGYYDNADGKTKNELKAALNTIIKGHTEYSYTSTNTDTWDILKESDRDPNNADNVIYFYTGRSENAAQEYNSGSGWSREHVWAKSRGDFGTTKGPGTDCHHLRPADISVNSTRSNRAFAEGGDEVWDNGVFTGCYKGATDFTFEPRDAVKGDVARMIFYMVVRYEGEGDEPDLELTEQILPSTDKQPIHGVGSVLLKWHLNDPVDDFERNRNEVVYSYQGNRNPFIDHPEYAELIWDIQNDIKEVRGGAYKVFFNNGAVEIESNTQLVNSIEVFTISGKKVYAKNNISTMAYNMPLKLESASIYLVRVNQEEVFRICPR
ncbi:endonuclease [Carboxylicivirga sediminis]|uniref:Endonuclease n=1 Tax=Carboxylicivirga sediminis TaxID=2006564 RepID=A0A941IXB2_9BACT|nr:endonuclease [Carboxylicivirga sediminis]MBR8535423.1 endonuclease [Carboxylicivirga sediminis]